MQRVMKAPLVDLSLSAWGWFNLIFGFAAVTLVILMSIHARRRLAILPATWLGRGQLLYFFLLWSFVIGNFGKALAGFGEQRLLTEGVILANAVIVTLMILVLPQDDAQLPATTESTTEGSFVRLCWGAVAAAVLAAAVIPPAEACTVRLVYGDAFVGHRGQDFRFGPKATWKLSPHVKKVRDRSL